MTEREIALRVAWAYLGRPYIWGGDDPQGFDCSGYMIECLRSAGVFPRKQDTTADGLFRLYERIEEEEIQPGDLVFWKGENRMVHVGMVIEGRRHYLGAEGGGSSTTSAAEAWRRNAYIQVNPLRSRGTQDTRFYAAPAYDDSLGA